MAAKAESRNCLVAFFASDYNNFLVLLITTPASILVLYSSLNSVLFSGSFFKLVTDNRPTIGLVVQVLANMLSAVQMLVLCRLINFSVRRYLTQNSIGLDSLRALNDAMVPRINWDLPFEYSVLLICFVILSMAFSALWAAALTPVERSDLVLGSIVIPSWANTSLIREYPSEVGMEGPTEQNIKGRFTYSPGIQLLGSLLSGATSATTPDRSVRVHAKLDKSRYNYIGRSYGVGVSPGLADEHINDQDLALGYKYQELGYKAAVECIYNRSTEFRLEKDNDTSQYKAHGNLPDTDNGPGWSMYTGVSITNIVAVGVAHLPPDMGAVAVERKYVTFAAGFNNDFLDEMQCKINFTPTKFNVTVQRSGKNITVVATNETGVADIDPSRYLKAVLLRQFELIANDETNMYVSMVGQAMNASITDLRTSLNLTGTAGEVSDEQIALRGVANAITVMTDDMLSVYAMAQLMVGKFQQNATAEVRHSAIAIGESRYSIAVFAINTVILLLFALEAVRTRWWRGLPLFDTADLRHMVVAASEGGSSLGKAGFGAVKKIGDLRVRCGDAGVGRFAIVLDGDEASSPQVEYAYERMRTGKTWSPPPPRPPPPGMI